MFFQFVNSVDPAKKFYGQTRQDMGGSFYIDIIDVMAAAKMQGLHQLLKLDIVPEKRLSCTYRNFTEGITPNNIYDAQILMISETYYLLKSTDSVKHKIIYIARYLTKLSCRTITLATKPDNVSFKSLEELN